MAGTAISCASSRRSSRPSSSDNTPASPRTPICKEERLDFTAEECCCASPPLSPFATAVEKERSLREHDAALSLIERLDDGWFRDNVVSCRWGSSRLASVDVSGVLREPSGIRTPEAGSSTVDQVKLSPFRSIEMVKPLVTSRSSSSERDGRDLGDLPLSKLWPLSRRSCSVNDGISLSDGERTHYFKSQESDGFRRFGELRIEPSKLSVRRRSKRADEDVPSRRFSDGDETAEDVRAPLPKVREESETDENPSNKKQVSRKLALPSLGIPISSGKEIKNPLVQSNTRSVPPRRRRRDRKKNSKSLTDVEYDEMRACMDLGFNINKDDVTPRVVNVFLGHKDGYIGGDDFFDSPRERTNSPQGWTRGRPESPLLNWGMSAPNGNNVDMKAHLKFWAHAIVSTVSAEC